MFVALDYTVNIGYNTLIFFLSLIMFSFAFYSNEYTRTDRIIKSILYWLDSFLFLILGVLYVGINQYLGIIFIVLGAFDSFIGLIYAFRWRN